ncbi:MAG: helix-turn-helix domain-containing protein [Ardenticatenaceae bacterium]|nr:helix-turn-helix domain-containing protein [Ardenticatenaceae bacterium]
MSNDDFFPLGLSDDSGERAIRSDAAANRTHILAVAAELFAQHGPEAVSMSDIVEASDVGRGTIYRHFPNKGALCLALIDEELRLFQEDWLANMREQTDETPMVQLANFLEMLLRFTQRNMPLTLESQRQGIYYFGKLEPRQFDVATVRGLMQAAVRQGELAAELDIDVAADALLAALYAPLIQYQIETRGFSIERIGEGLRSMVMQLRRT